MTVKEAICRQATLEDVEDLYRLIDEYAAKGIMLPRSREALARHIDTFVVAVIDGTVVGCGSLFQLGPELVEIRSLGISERYKGYGIGSQLVDVLVRRAREQHVPKVMALTYAVDFFRKNGFEVVDKEIFPEKVWTDCIQCPKRHACDEIAVLKVLN